MDAPWIILNPIPPDPHTTTDSPILSFALLFITPNPVVIAHPIREAISESKASGILVILFSETTASLLKVVTQPAFILPNFFE
jgi:hypothetical protein